MKLPRRETWATIRWLKKALWITAAFYVYNWAGANPKSALTVLALLGQLMFVVFFILIQFIAMFAFLSRSRVETILPGQAGTVTMEDYWGQPSIKSLVSQWISLLRGVPAFQKLGGTLPTGVLLAGGPGTGKSYLAKAIAGTSGLPFMSLDASSFSNMFMGVGALKVINFYRKAKQLAREYSGCIVFIDEIDAIARSRMGTPGPMQRAVQRMIMGGMGGGGTMELSTLLYELDGSMERTRVERLMSRLYALFHKKLPPKDYVVFTMAATNVPEVLDPALIRAGRLDRTIVVDTPDREGRKEIVSGYLKRIKAAPDVNLNLDALVDEMSGMTPAQVWRVVTTEAPRVALFKKAEAIEFAHIQAALREMQVGLKTPIRGITDEERTALASHEAGHAVLVWLLTTHRLTNVTIVRYEEALGHVLHHEVREQHLKSLKNFWYDLIISLGGRAGEILKYGGPLASVGGDYHHAIHVARVLLEQGLWGTPIATEKEFSERVRVLFDAGLAHAKRLLGEYVELHTKLVDALMDHDELGHEELAELWGNRPKVSVELPEPPPGFLPRPQRRKANGHTA